MQIGELSRRSGVSVASIKYYVREGLLPAGVSSKPRQADYDEAHLRRLRLIRALREVGGLTVAEAADVLAATSDDLPRHDAFGVIQDAVVRLPDESPPAAAIALVDALVERHDLHVRPGAPVRALLAHALARLGDFGWPLGEEWLDVSLESARTRATADAASLPLEGDRTEQLEYVLLGTVLIEAVLTALRRLALEDASFRLFAEPDR